MEPTTLFCSSDYRKTLFLCGFTVLVDEIIVAGDSDRHRFRRFIQACLRDHPRVCGEHIDFMILGKSDRGSSPRMRGTRIASKSQSIANLSVTQAVALLEIPAEERERGSSPRMRGTPLTMLADALEGGIIPAYAGNTLILRSLPRERRDHPRVCGEHTLGKATYAMEQGSSPRMRGTRSRCQRR